MEILKIVGIGLVTLFCFLALREQKPEIAYLLTIAGGVLILLVVVDYLVKIVGTLTNLVSAVGLSNEIISAVLKIIGVGYLTEFGAGVCEDAGSKSIADKILLGGKIIIMFLSLPIITGLINIIAGLLK